MLDRKQRGYQKSDPSWLIEFDTARCLWFHTHSEPAFPHDHFFSPVAGRNGSWSIPLSLVPLRLAPSQTPWCSALLHWARPSPCIWRAQACDQSSHLSDAGLWSVISSQCYRLVISHLISMLQACDQSTSSQCYRLVVCQHHLSATGLWSVSIISVLPACGLSTLFQWCRFVVCWQNLDSTGLWSVNIISVVRAYGLSTSQWYRLVIYWQKLSNAGLWFVDRTSVLQACDLLTEPQ